jgi:hypothetical protein
MSPQFAVGMIAMAERAEGILHGYQSGSFHWQPIGVSKLSCYPCYTLFHAYNTSGLVNQRFFTKGSHAKVSPHWSIPSGFGDDKDKVVWWVTSKLT